eukprot:tig00000981_g5885.t1
MQRIRTRGRKRVYFTCISCGKRARALVGEEDAAPCGGCGAEHPYSGAEAGGAAAGTLVVLAQWGEPETPAEPAGAGAAAAAAADDHDHDHELEEDVSAAGSEGEEDGGTSSGSEDLLTSVLGICCPSTWDGGWAYKKGERKMECTELYGVLTDVSKVLHFCRELDVDEDAHTIYSAKISRKDALWRIERFFATRTGALVLHYSGHGEDDSGDWILGLSAREEYLSFKDVVGRWEASHARQRGSELLLLLDACHSGAWVHELKKHVEKKGDVAVAVQASCQREQRSSDEGAWTKEFIRYQKSGRISDGFLSAILKKSGQLPMAFASWGKENSMTYDFGEFTLLNQSYFLREARRREARKGFKRAGAAQSVKVKGLQTA